ncbi:hypothetical protein [Bradyrhizobium prioriisuperbiae]|uniref:hypothetical protein n=1 Tax=Bradyrhizobium prioriisuperbiae TaxID=2854389 RepID=UPI0028EA7A2B|nr:hypothetical protein [Bradyrhizobium prioritasuperba]
MDGDPGTDANTDTGTPKSVTNPTYRCDDFDDDFADAVIGPLLLSVAAGTDAHDAIWFLLQEKDAMNSRKRQEHR